MNRILHTGFLLTFLAALTDCNGQNQYSNNNSNTKLAAQTNRVGGDCEAGYCDLIYAGMPKEINSVDTSASWFETGQKLVVSGTVFQIDGKTPAQNVIVYYHHTDNDGYYSPRNDKPENQTRHGHIRGWVKTDENGKYTVYTIRPAPYPNEEFPAHIHLIIKEPDIANEYWVNDIVFDDDTLLIPYRKKHPSLNEGGRGGSGIVQVLLKDGLQIAEHTLVLGLNIPNYPKKAASGIQSGLNVGVGQPSFDPFHAYGPDKGSHACPVCKYGYYHGILYFVGNNPNWNEIKSWLRYLEQESVKRKKYLKAYFVYGNGRSYSQASRRKELEQIGKELDIKNVALTFVPSFSDKKTNVNLSKINPDVENTFILYRRRNIIDKYIDLKPTSENFKLLSDILDRTKGDYFDLPEPKHR
jgi:protocatechuate 3,4-dioxygenase beta subunit